MSTIIRSVIVAAALIASASAASATSYGYGYGYGYTAQPKQVAVVKIDHNGHRWVKVHGVWKRESAREFFDRLQRDSD
jgi:hypothetical protein